MDFGIVGLDHGLGVSSSSPSSSSYAGFAPHISSSSDIGTEKHKTVYGSGFCINNNKQERSEGSDFNDHWRSSKLSKTNSDADFSASRALRNSNLLMRSNSTLGFFDNGGHPAQHQMLSFSSPKPEPLPYSPNTLLSTYNSRNMAGFNSGSLVNGGNVMHGEKVLFTPSQWMELEQQALIYKYISASVPIPSNLLLPIRKTLDSVGFSSFPSGLLRSNNTLGWGAFHLGFSTNNDPEPGRCRRTDGKKWRCSKDAVADQKYCERHMNRGRHRSRKPVEGQTGHSLAVANAAALTSTSSVALPVGGTTSNSLAATSTNMNRQHQLQSLNRMQSTHGGLSLSSRSDQFVVVSNSEPQQQSLRQFIDVDWPNKTGKPNPNDGNHSTVSNWPDSEQTTQLSISISTMSSSDANLLHNAASADHNPHHHQRQALNLIPTSWEPSLGGPLGEVLHHTNNSSSSSCSNNNNVNSGDCKGPLSSSSLSVLNLMTEGWDPSPPMGSSPTGVLQKTVFGSLSNSSAGSSPRADSNKDLVASARLNTSL